MRHLVRGIDPKDTISYYEKNNNKLNVYNLNGNLVDFKSEEEVMETMFVQARKFASEIETENKKFKKMLAISAMFVFMSFFSFMGCSYKLIEELVKDRVFHKDYLLFSILSLSSTAIISFNAHYLLNSLADKLESIKTYRSYMRDRMIIESMNVELERECNKSCWEPDKYEINLNNIDKLNERELVQRIGDLKAYLRFLKEENKKNKIEMETQHVKKRLQ